MADEKTAEKKAEKTSGDKAKTASAAPTGELACSAPKCKQGVRAKGYCRKHFMAWRRAELGKKHRYKICSKEACRKPRALGGLCEEHSGKAKPAEGSST
jgi:hypothetical protein